MGISRRLCTPVLLTLSLTGAGTAYASVIDQSDLNTGYGFNDANHEFQQQVTDGIGGVLAGVQLYSFDNGDDDTTTVSIGLGPGWFTGTFAFTSIATLTPEGTFIDTSAADISLTPGEEFVIDVSDGQGPGFLGGPGIPNTPYAGGDLYVDGRDDTTTNNADYSMTFETFVNSSAPEPGTPALLGGGLFALVLMQRKIRRAGVRGIAFRS